MRGRFRVLSIGLLASIVVPGCGRSGEHGVANPSANAFYLKTTSPFFEGSPAILDGSVSEPFDFGAPGTESFFLTIHGSASLEIGFDDSAFLDPSHASAQEVVLAVNQQFLTASLSKVVTASISPNHGLRLVTSMTGESATLAVVEGVGNAAQALGLSTDLVAGSILHAANSLTPLNDLTDNVTDYSPGDEIFINGAEQYGALVSAAFIFGPVDSGFNGTTFGDLVGEINWLFQDWSSSGATCTIDSLGNLVLSPNYETEIVLEINISDGVWPGPFLTNWAVHPFAAGSP